MDDSQDFCNSLQIMQYLAHFITNLNIWVLNQFAVYNFQSQWI